MKWEINLSEFTPFIILCVIVVTLPANSLGAFPLCMYMQSFSIFFMVSEQWGVGAKTVTFTLRHWAKSHASSGGITPGPGSGSCFPQQKLFFLCLLGISEAMLATSLHPTAHCLVLCCVAEGWPGPHAALAIVGPWITWDHKKPKPTAVVFPAASLQHVRVTKVGKRKKHNHTLFTSLL